MAETNGIRVNHTKVGEQFKLHLDDPINEQIIFSGPFGTGKTTFLSEYFESDLQYFNIKLSPVKYSIGSNEDIIEWIKYDIILELIKRYASDLQLEKDGFSNFLLVQMYLLKKAKSLTSIRSILDDDLTLDIISLTDKLGKPIGPLMKLAGKLSKDYKEFTRDIKIDEGDVLMAFIRKVQAAYGSPYEFEGLSGLIKQIIGRIELTKGNAGKVADAVLIIDDLDRIDPEHIFRLFNVFSTQHDSDDNHKFGFKKVIFVCDIENIRTVFHHRFGEHADFSGYIDKFYSCAPFFFDNRKYIKEIVAPVSRQVKFEVAILNRSLKGNNYYDFFSVLQFVLQSMVEARVVNLRTLIQTPTAYINNELFFVPNIRSDLWLGNYPFLLLVICIRRYFPTLDVFQKRLKKITDSYWRETKYNYDRNNGESHLVPRLIAYYCLPFLIDELRAFDQETMAALEKTSGPFSYESNNCVVKYSITRSQSDFGNFVLRFEGIYDKVGGSNKIEANVFELLDIALTNCRKLCIIQ